MSSEQLTSFNLHLAKQCRPIANSSSNDNFKKISLKYSKSNGSTSSYFNSEFDDDLELDEDAENSNDTSSSESALLYGSKFSDFLPKSSGKTVLNEPNSGRSKIDTRQRINPCISKRRAANLRERKRMKSINYAFDVSDPFEMFLILRGFSFVLINFQIGLESLFLKPPQTSYESQRSLCKCPSSVSPNEAGSRHVSSGLTVVCSALTNSYRPT